MGESFRCDGFKWRLSVRGRRAGSTPGASRCEEKEAGQKKGRVATMKLTKQPPLGPVFNSYSVAVCVRNYRAQNDAVQSMGFPAGNAPKPPKGHCGRDGPKCPTDYANIASLAAI